MLLLAEFKLACLILAAGRSQRFGAPKQLADLNGKPLLASTLETLKSAQITTSEDIYIAIGANKDLIRQRLSAQTNLLEIQQWQQGMGQSLQESIKHLAVKSYSHVMVALADQIAIPSSKLKELYKVCLENKEHIIASHYSDSFGVPVIFPRWCFEELMQLSGDSGAKAIIKKNTNKTIAVDIPEAAIDIDTQEQLKTWLSNTK